MDDLDDVLLLDLPPFSENVNFDDMIDRSMDNRPKTSVLSAFVDNHKTLNFHHHRRRFVS